MGAAAAVDAPAARSSGFFSETRNPPGTSELVTEGEDNGTDSQEFGREGPRFTDACDASLEGDGADELEIDEPSEPFSKDDSPTAETTTSKDRTAPRITLEMLSQGGFYDMPMAKAAQLLGRTEGSFQRVCRGLGILRWPYRVRKSLQAIMAKTEEYLGDETQEDGMSKAEVLKVLQARMDDIKGISGTGMDKATKQYRQYIFKLNHKLARRAAKKGEDAPEAGQVKAKGILRAASKIQQPRPMAAASNFLSKQQGSDPSSGNASDTGIWPARPTPRRLGDLPAGLALQHLATEAGGGDSRARPAAATEYQRAFLQDDQELLRVCAEMDKHLAAARDALMLRGPYLPARLSNLYLQQALGAELGLPSLPPPPFQLSQPPPPQASLPGHSFWPVR